LAERIVPELLEKPQLLFHTERVQIYRSHVEIVASGPLRELSGALDRNQPRKMSDVAFDA